MLVQNKNFHQLHEDFTELAFQDSSLLPDRYVFVLTNLCNLRCSFCFQKKELRKEAMTSDDWIHLAKQLPDYARVTFTGGEPLLFPGFKEVFSYIAPKFNCNLITNGLLLTPAIIDFLFSFPRFKVLSLSLDNIGNTVRGVTPQQWTHLEEMIGYFHKRKSELNHECLLDIKIVVLDENADDLFEIYRYFVEKLRCGTLAFQFLKGSSIQHADYMFEFADLSKKSNANIYRKIEIIKRQLELVREYNLKNNKVSFLHPKIDSLTSEEQLIHLDLMNQSEHQKEIYAACKFPWSSVHINVDGTLFPCLAVAMGNVKETPLAEIIRGLRFTQFKKLIRKEGTLEACNRCGWLRLNDKSG